VEHCDGDLDAHFSRDVRRDRRFVAIVIAISKMRAKFFLAGAGGNKQIFAKTRYSAARPRSCFATYDIRA
jgi:hypothetical protein